MLIEDNLDHAELFSISLRRNFQGMRLIHARDEQEALEKLGLVPGCNGTRVVTPDLILLDVNLPQIHGKEVLKRIRSSRRFHTIPIFILTTSTRQEDREKMSRLGADAYIVKFAGKVDVGKRIKELLLETCGAG